MTTRNMDVSALQQRIVSGQLLGLLLQHHGNIVPDGVRQTIHAAHEHLSIPLILQCPLADRTGQYLQQTSIHVKGLLQLGQDGASARTTRFSNSRPCSSSNRTATGTYQSCACAIDRHLTASFSVMSTGKPSSNVRSEAA